LDANAARKASEAAGGTVMPAPESSPVE